MNDDLIDPAHSQLDHARSSRLLPFACVYKLVILILPTTSPLRNRLIQLERRMWSGIYKITWQNLASLKSWIEMCNETVLQQLKGIEEYKIVNKAINSILAEVQFHSSAQLQLFATTVSAIFAPTVAGNPRNRGREVFEDLLSNDILSSRSRRGEFHSSTSRKATRINFSHSRVVWSASTSASASKRPKI